MRMKPMNRFARIDTRETETAEGLLGTVAIVGFPNVGKSTLVNRLTESRAAVVHETPGVTRDRKELIAEWHGKRFLLVDTGGVDIASTDPITRSIAEQAKAAVEEADLVLFLTDARAGITPGDEELAQILRAARKPVIVIANKIDDPDQDALAFEFHRLGLGDPVPLSAMHGHGTGDLLDTVVARLPGRGRPAVSEEAIRVAILGRPNVGKSSLLNALLGEERVIVSDQPGTTRDAIDTVFRRGEREGVVDHDLTVADVARKAQCSTIAVLSKWDLSQVEIEDVRARLGERLRQRPPVLTVSAKTGRGIARLLDRIETQFDKHSARIPTGELNRFLAELRETREAPARNGRRLNLLYGTQVRARPPRFRFFVNDPSLITRDYGYWVENQLRERFELTGVPVAIDFVRRS